MKRYIQIISFLLIAAITFNSCKKNFLETVPVSNLSDLVFFKTETDIDQAVAGVYNKLLRLPDFEYEYLSEIRSKNYFVPRQDAARDYFSISAFELTSALGTLQSNWANNYELIERAN